ncbi:hypothetical protein AAMO2058_000580800 [Amorphochlora amoebiformis]
MAAALAYQNVPEYEGSEMDTKIKVTVLEKKSAGSHARGEAKSTFVYLTPSETIRDVKRAIRSSMGHHEDQQTVIYKGQVLYDDFILSSVPGMCGEDGRIPHIRIVLNARDVESQGPTKDGFGQHLDGSNVKASAPPPGYFRQQSVFRQRGRSNSFSQAPVFEFPREIDEESALVRKVYLALSIQMVATTIICGMFMFYEPLHLMVLRNLEIFFYGSMILSFGTLFGLYCYKTQYPMNLYILCAFTGAMACQIGVICAVYTQAGMSELVLQAFIYTAAIFGALTIYAFTTKIDVRSWGPYLFMGLVVLLIWGLVSMLFGFKSNWFYSLGGALLFSAYILYDTSRLLHTFGADEDWIFFTIDLYLDIVNLFLFILQLLAKSNRD